MTDLEKARAAVAHASRLAANGAHTEARLYLAAARCALHDAEKDLERARFGADAVDAELRRVAGAP